MKSKIGLGSVLTIVGILSLIYAAFEEIAGYAPNNIVFGVILIGIVFFFVGITMLRGAIDGV